MLGAACNETVSIREVDNQTNSGSTISVPCSNAINGLEVEGRISAQASTPSIAWPGVPYRVLQSQNGAVLEPGCDPDTAPRCPWRMVLAPTNPLVSGSTYTLTATYSDADPATAIITLTGACPQPLPFCGDGQLNAANEQCDDGNLSGCDGCSASCTVESFQCGNGIVECSESCDDGNTINDCNCRSDCAAPGCRDGVVCGSEQCDDGNGTAGDGCSPGCLTEPVLNTVAPAFAPVDGAKQLTTQGAGWFTNDRNINLAAAVVNVTTTATTLSLVVDILVGFTATQSFSVALNKQAAANVWGTSGPVGPFQLAGGANTFRFRVVTGGLLSNTLTRSVESAWAEIVIDPAVVIGGFLIRDDFSITGQTNRNDLVFQARKSGGATRDLPWLPLPAGGLFSFSIRVDGGGHATHVGFRRPGRPAFEVLDTSFTLDPSIFLAPVALWIVRGLADSNAPAQNCGGNVGSDGGVAELTEFFDDLVYSEPNPAVNVRSSADVIWAQVGVQFDVEEANIVNIVDDLAANAFDGHGNCSISGIFCNPGNGNADCLPSGGICVQTPRSLAACCRYGYDPRNGREGVCCNASGRYIHTDGTTLVPCTDVRTRDDEGCSVVIGHDIGWAIIDSANVTAGRSPDRLNLYFLNNLRTGSGMANGHRLAFGHRAAAFYDDNIPCRASLGEASLIVAHELGHLMGLDHVCARNDRSAPNHCCTLPTGRCSTDNFQCDPRRGVNACSAGGVCTVNATTGEFECSESDITCVPPPVVDLAADSCLISGDGICLLQSGCPLDTMPSGMVNPDYINCNYANQIMNQTDCTMGTNVQESSYYQPGIVIQSLLNSGAYEAGNLVRDRNQ